MQQKLQGNGIKRQGQGPETLLFRVSPLVRYTLYGLLFVLVFPIPFLMIHLKTTDTLPAAALGVLIGYTALIGLMSQRVQIDGTGVRVGYAPWVPAFLVKGWSLDWSEVQDIRSRPTGQGGRVHYLVSKHDHEKDHDKDQQAYLLPMRIAGFARFLRELEAYTGIDTTRVKPLAQPWMYLTLLGCVVLMFLMDLWIVTVAMAR
jgi:hypothetical protein